MSTKIELGKQEHNNSPAWLDLDLLVKTRLLIQANSGGGKSWLIRRIAEQAFGHIPIIIIDPEGDFLTLREKFGFVLVGKGGETPADPRSIELVIHKLLELRASAVIDLYDMKPSQRHTCVKLLSEAAINAPKKLWRPTLFIFDEAHMFAPEKGESEASEAVIGFPTRGRKRRFGTIFATQRLAELSKAVTSQLLNRIIGSTFEDMDLKRVRDILSIPNDERKDFDKAMRTLEAGFFFGFGRAISKTRILFHSGPVQTSHEIEESKYGSAPPPPPEKIKELLPQLADLPKQAEEKIKTEAELRAEIRSLKAHLLATPVQSKPEIQKVSILLPDDTKRIQQVLAHLENINSWQGSIRNEYQSLIPAIQQMAKAISKPLITVKAEPAGWNPPTQMVYLRPSKTNPTLPSADNLTDSLPKGERKILTACAQYHPKGCERDQLSGLTGFKRATRDAYVKRLRDKNFVTQQDAFIVATDAGLAALGSWEPLPDGQALIDHWIEKLPLGESVIFKILVELYPAPVIRESLEVPTGFKRATRDAYLARLITKKLVVAVDRGKVKAAEHLFNS